MALAKASRPWYAEKRFWALGLVAFFVTMTALGASKTPASSENVGGVRTLSVNGANPPQADVTLTSCSIGEYGLPSVKILITNRSSGRSNYIVSVNLLDAAGTKIGEGFASSNNVEAGQSAVDDVAAMVSAGTLARCVVTEVNRFASR
jgi:hypothetical protein